MRTRGRLALPLLAAAIVAVLAGCGSNGGGGGGGGGSQGASDYPTREIRMLVPFDAGGSTDAGVRIIAQALEREWDVPVTVVNQAGGNTVPAGQELATSRPDGYTVFADNQPASSMLEAAVGEAPYDVFERTFFSTAFSTPMVFLVPEDSPFKTLQDAADAFKQAPGDVRWTSLGGAGAQDFTFRQFFDAIGVPVDSTQPLTVTGGAPAVQETAGGRADLGVGSYATFEGLLDSGKVRPLAVAQKEDYASLPDVPTAPKAGFPDIEVIYWVGFSGPAGVDPAIVDVWNTTVQKVLEDPEVTKRLADTGIEPFYLPPEEMEQFIRDEKQAVDALFEVGG